MPRAIWMLSEDANARQVAQKCYAMDETLRVRSVGCAIIFAAVFLDTGLTDYPRHVAIGRTTFQRIKEDAR